MELLGPVAAPAAGASRRELKEKRDEIRELLARVTSELQSSSLSSRASVTSVVSRAESVANRAESMASAASLASRASSRASSRVPPASPRAAPPVAFKPPVLDPTEIVPAHLVEGFRREYREQQEARAAEEAAAKAAAAAHAAARTSAVAAERGMHEGEPTLEGYRGDRGLSPRAPPTPTDLRERVHGVLPSGERAFSQYPGAQSVRPSAKQELSPTKGRKIFVTGGPRAAQSTIGASLSPDGYWDRD